MEDVVGDMVTVTEGVGDEVTVNDGLGEREEDTDIVREADVVAVPVGDLDTLGDKETVPDADTDALNVTETVTLPVPDADAVGVAVPDAVADADTLLVDEKLLDTVAEDEPDGDADPLVVRERLTLCDAVVLALSVLLLVRDTEGVDDLDPETVGVGLGDALTVAEEDGVSDGVSDGDSDLDTVSVTVPVLDGVRDGVGLLVHPTGRCADDARAFAPPVFMSAWLEIAAPDVAPLNVQPATSGHRVAHDAPVAVQPMNRHENGTPLKDGTCALNISTWASVP